MTPPEATVFLMEDNEDIRSAAKESLTRAHHTIVGDTTDYETTIAAAKELTTPPVVAILDSAVPLSQKQLYAFEGAGAQAAEVLKKIFPEMTIVTFTGGTGRFSEHKYPGFKIAECVRDELGDYVTNLPATAK